MRIKDKHVVYDQIAYCDEPSRNIPEHEPTLAKALGFTIPVAVVDAAAVGAIAGAITGAGFSTIAAIAVGISAGAFALLAYSMCAVAGVDDEMSGR